MIHSVLIQREDWIHTFPHVFLKSFLSSSFFFLFVIKPFINIHHSCLVRRGLVLQAGQSRLSWSCICGSASTSKGRTSSAVCLMALKRSRLLKQVPVFNPFPRSASSITVSTHTQNDKMGDTYISSLSGKHNGHLNIKGWVDPEMKIQPYHLHADGKSDEVLSSTKHFWSLTAKQRSPKQVK